MKINDGVLVDQKWAERVNVKCFGLPVEGASNPVQSRFYDVRPVVLASAWSLSGGIYQATATFDGETTTVPIYAPTATDDPGGTVGTSKYFVVWRGRWELIAGEGGSTPTFDTETVLKTVSVGIVSDSAQSAQGGYIPVIVDAAANVAGALVFTFGYLHISQTTTTATVLKAPTT